MKKITAMLTVLALALGLCACSAKNELVTWQGQYDLGVRYLGEGKCEKAIGAFTAAIELEPKQAPVYESRGDAYAAHAKQLMADDPESGEALEAYENAVQDYLTAIKLDDSVVSAYQKAADVYAALGDTESGLRILERGMRNTGDLSLQTAFDTLNGVIVPGDLVQGSGRWAALEAFLANFGWYGDYDRETAAIRTGGNDWSEPQNALEKMLTVASCYSYNDALYPGEESQDFWDEPDPLGKWASYTNSYMKVNAVKLEWVLRYIFNCSISDIRTMRKPILTGEDEYIYYQDGYYYFVIGGIGGGYDASITSVEQRGARFYVEYNLDTGYFAGTTSKCAVVSLKEIDGREYWTLYCTRELEDSEMDWRRQYRKFVYNESYLQYGGPYNEGEGWGRDYEPVTFSLRDLGGDGIPELIIYNGCDYEAGAFYNIFTSEPAGVRYVGTAGFRIGGFGYSDNPGYQGLFYINGNMGAYTGHYYYMEDGEIIDEWVLTEEDAFFIDGSDGYITTQVTSDDVLFAEFQSGDGHALAAYTMAEIYTMGWDAFIRETGGQTWS